MPLTGARFKPNIACVKVATEWCWVQNPPLAPKVAVSRDCLDLGWPTGGIWLAVCIFFSRASTLVSKCAPVTAITANPQHSDHAQTKVCAISERPNSSCNKSQFEFGFRYSLTQMSLFCKVSPAVQKLDRAARVSNSWQTMAWPYLAMLQQQASCQTKHA